MNENLTKLDVKIRQFLESNKYEDRFGTISILKGTERTYGGALTIPIYLKKHFYKEDIFPDKYELIGLFVKGVGIYSVNCNCRDLFINQTWSNPDILDISTSRKELSKIIPEEFKKYIATKYNLIPPAILTENDKEKIKNQYMNGQKAESAEKLIESYKNYCTEKDTINSGLKLSEEEGFIIFTGTKESEKLKEKISKEYIKLKDVDKQISYRKAKAEYLLELEKGLSKNHDRLVKVAMQDLKYAGAKYVNVTFDFGYEQVTVKVNTSGSWCWLQTQNATNEFEKRYKQVISMKSYSVDFENFIPYITKIEYKKKIYFDGKAEINNPKENQLYSLLICYGEKGSKSIRESVLTIINNEKIDYTIMNNAKPVFEDIINRFYTDVDIVKALINAGCNNKVRKDKISNYRSSRNYNDILPLLDVVEK